MKGGRPGEQRVSFSPDCLPPLPELVPESPGRRGTAEAASAPCCLLAPAPSQSLTSARLGTPCEFSVQVSCRPAYSSSLQEHSDFSVPQLLFTHMLAHHFLAIFFGGGGGGGRVSVEEALNLFIFPFFFKP